MINVRGKTKPASIPLDFARLYIKEFHQTSRALIALTNSKIRGKISSIRFLDDLGLAVVFHVDKSSNACL